MTTPHRSNIRFQYTTSGSKWDMCVESGRASSWDFTGELIFVLILCLAAAQLPGTAGMGSVRCFLVQLFKQAVRAFPESLHHPAKLKNACHRCSARSCGCWAVVFLATQMELGNAWLRNRHNINVGCGYTLESLRRINFTVKDLYFAAPSCLGTSVRKS